MIVPVAWVTFEDGTRHSAYWDQSLLFDVFTGAAWRVPGGVTFEHYDGTFPDAPGTVVVFPARHNAGHLERLNAEFDRYEWVVVIGTGDEEAVFPWGQIHHRRRKLWAMGVFPGSNVDRPLGSGYSPGFPDLLREAAPFSTPGRLDVFFCGQDTHERRHAALKAAENAVPANRRRLVATDRFLADANTGGLGREDYALGMLDAKIALCPSGPESPDSFRLYEALEAGCVPIADGATPKRPLPGYWPYMLGEVPFPVVTDWCELPDILEMALGAWPLNAAKVTAWWIAQKRRMAYALDADVRELSNVVLSRPTPDDQITVIIPTCPIPSHPDTAMIETVIDSVREQLPTAEIVVVCDGIRPSMQDRAAEYHEFLLRLTRLCAHRWSNVVPVILDDWVHQAGGTRTALELVTTPLVLFCEHDTPLTGEIDWDGLCRVVSDGVVNMVRLHHETIIGEYHQDLMLDRPEVMVGATDESEGVPLVRTVQWSQRPHLATTKFYRERVMPLFPPDACTYLEWVMHGEVVAGIEHGMEQTWNNWRVAIYHPGGGNIQRSLHLDGRAGASTDDSVKAFERMQGKS